MLAKRTKLFALLDAIAVVLNNRLAQNEQGNGDFYFVRGPTKSIPINLHAQLMLVSHLNRRQLPGLVNTHSPARS